MNYKKRHRAEQLADAWNARNPVGTLVDYLPSRNSPQARRHRTRSPAWVLGDHTAVVLLEGFSGAVAIDHCTAIEEPTPAA